MTGPVELLQRARTAAERATPGPLLVRAGIFVTALAAALTAYPAELVTSQAALALVLVAALPAAAPRRAWPTVFVVVTVVGWLISTMGYEEPVTLFRLLSIAALMYLTHSLAALAAMLPYDAVVAPEVLVRWLGRALLVVVASVALSLVVVTGADLLRDGAYLAASLAGLVVTVTLAALLTWLLRRP